MELTENELTAEELHEKLTTGVMEGTDISLFSVKQLYGLYFYDRIENKNVDFKTMLDYMISASANENINAMFDENTVVQLGLLSAGVAQFEAQMETQMNKETFKGWFYQNAGVALTDEQLAQIWIGYFATTGETTSETIPFLPLMNFLVQSGQITDETNIATINGYNSLYNTINAEYGYENFLSTFSTVAYALSGAMPQITEANMTKKRRWNFP